MEAEKQLAAKKKGEAVVEDSAKPSKESGDSTPSTMGSKEQLPSVPEQSKPESKPNTKETSDVGAKESAPKTVFGSSATLSAPPMTFGAAAAKPPDCPKPSIFAAPASGSTLGGAVPTSAFGGAAAKPTEPSSTIFGGATPSKPAFGGAAANSGEPKAPGGSSGSGAFLDLTPPGKVSAGPGKFVFGKSANITLAVPSGTTSLASFAGKTTTKFGTGSFGDGFGGVSAFGTSPFGGEDASKKRPLDATSEEKAEEPESKQSRNDNNEATGDAPPADEAAAAEE